MLQTTTTTSTSSATNPGTITFAGLVFGSHQVAVVAPAGGVMTEHTNTNTVNTLLSGGTASAIEDVYASPGDLTVIKLPSQVEVGTCGQVTYTYDVTNTGTTALANVQISDNIGTAASPDLITPTAVTSCGYNVGDTNHNGVLDAGETWQFTNTINEAGSLTGGKSAQCRTLSGGNLGSGCTAWLNSSFTPTSCEDGTSYTFQNVTCTISGPGCSTQTIQVPNAVVTFSSRCTTPTTTYDSTQNCWVTTLPAGSNPGNVFLSGLPFEIPSGCNLSGATVTWNIGQSSNNCGAGSVSWQTGCSGYSGFSSSCLSDLNQIAVKVCDAINSYGNTGCGSWSSGNWTYALGFGCAGTPGTQYDGWNWSGGTCGNGSGSGSACQGQLADSSEADTVTVTASALGQGFSLGDAANYGIIAFDPGSFQASGNDPITGNVGIGNTASFWSWWSWWGSTVSLGGDKITGQLVTTGSAPCATGGSVTGGVSGNSSTLSADIAALARLSSTLGQETGAKIALTSGMTINATSGKLDSSGNYVFTVTQWANNITIAGDGTHNVVLNVASGVTPVLDNVTLTGGLTANEVLFNDQNCSTIKGAAGTTFNATMLAPNATFAVNGVTVNGHLYGGADGQTFALSCGATVNTPASTTTTTPAAATVSVTDSKEVQVPGSNSCISVNGCAPTGSLSALYGTAEKLESTYSAGNTVSLKQIQAGMASVSGSNGNQMAFIEISNSANPFASNASIYFEGDVTSGEKIFADATLNQLTNTPVAARNNHFSMTAGADIYAYVFNSQSDFLAHASPLQTMVYNTSGSQAMHLGDRIGSLTLAGYVGTTGGYLVS
ncbi:DUF7467 domain-containing protein [Rhodopila globiformis]|uniref:DUF11 domain-containing protein n=1 Tax=Rhodopila globiformis TaxID=1071 RepID=A0A2S6N0G8_RHOGL|nr:collagen-binding domain-containing protein [Rhodopila globiformis]PPQ28114.1 hypothetical protein CCS01_25045 [Rhodopila globiformis]